MSVWDGIERVVKIAGIVGGVAAAVGVYVQLRDINNKDELRKIEDWQSAAVYKIITSNYAPSRFDDISLRYTSEAQKLPQLVPREKLNDSQLSLVLLKLLQGNAIAQTANGVYMARYAQTDEERLATMFRMMNETNRQVALHTQLAFDQLSQSNTPLTVDQLRQRMSAAGGDTVFLKDNLPIVLQQMNMQSLLIFTEDGRVAKGFGSQVREAVTTTVDAPPEVKKILPEIGIVAMQFIMTNRPDSYTLCYNSNNPPELDEGNLLPNLATLKLIRLNMPKGVRDASGKPCTLAVQVEFTNLGVGVQNYYYAYLQTLMK